MSEKIRQRHGVMCACSEASQLLREIVTPPKPGESVKSLIGRAARLAGMTYSRAKGIWYREARFVSSEEMDTLRTLAGRPPKPSFAERLARLESALMQTDPDFHAVSIERLRAR